MKVAEEKPSGVEFVFATDKRTFELIFDSFSSNLYLRGNDPYGSKTWMAIGNVEESLQDCSYFTSLPRKTVYGSADDRKFALSPNGQIYVETPGSRDTKDWANIGTFVKLA